MRIVIQRTTNASVTIDNQVTAAIGKGYVILVGIEQNDTKDDANWLIHKIIGLRIFDDEQGVMNLSIMDIQGEILVVSQFTLLASYKKATDRHGFGPQHTTYPCHSTTFSVPNCLPNSAETSPQEALEPT